ncbi:CD109 antigen-like [Tropilaelaps mercedesae]|uniref:CD109 antigen n=1 Tax=Tropilaelaps mercedesae TaxID=418985 RepID=A0A1V9XXY0_9ACAR|nr:CD109 antigen-like [Tropilaelaps mercedesae]
MPAPGGGLLLLAVVGLLIWAPQQIWCQSRRGVYTIVAPAILRPNVVFNVAASVGDVPNPVDMRLSIQGNDERGQFNQITRTAQVTPVRTELISFEIGDWSPGNYTLKAEGTGSIQFTNQTALSFVHKSYSVFIQTDKAIYKPGQRVQFRMIVTDPFLQPSVTGAIDAWVTDGKGNRIHSWKRQFTTRGVLGNEFELSDSPVLGDWTLHCEVLGQKFSKSFQVAEYVLPTFQVKVELPKYVTYNESDVVATVKAAYTYGKPVKGWVTLTVTPRSRYQQIRPRPYEQFQKKVPIDGEANIPLKATRDLQLKTDFFQREIEFFALVEEEFTGRKYNTTSYMPIYDKPVRCELVKTSDTFKPGLKYTAFLKVAYQDDTPVQDPENQITFRYGYNYDEEHWTEQKHWIPSNGVIRLEFVPPNAPTTVVLGMHAEYKGHIFYLESIMPAKSPSFSFIQARLLSPENPRVGDRLEFEVSSTHPLDHISYQVMGRGDIVTGATLALRNETTHRFGFTASFKLAPKARLVVYTVGVNKEVVTDGVNFDVSGILRTPVDVAVSARQTSPGSRVEVTVSTTPSSYVGILGVDQSVLLLRTGNDLSEKQVVQELESYDAGKKAKMWPPYYRRRRRRSLWYPGSYTAGDLFKDAGMIVLTNGFIFEQDEAQFRSELVDYSSETLPEHMAGEIASYEPHLDSKFADSLTDIVRLRKNFAETWLWKDHTSSSDGRAVISEVIPDTITSWVITAFAMDQATGLGIAPSPAKITTFRPFFVTVSLPYSVKRDESIAIQCVVFNYGNKPIEADVTLDNTRKDFIFTSEASKPDRKRVTVQPQNGTPVTFLITPTKLGYIDIKVMASHSYGGDSISKKLLVQPEGSRQYFNKAILLERRNSQAAPSKYNVSVTFPKNSVPQSEHVYLTAVGDILGPSVSNLRDLLKMPHGCGEQNMVDFVPNVVVLDYLNASKRLTPYLESQARRNIEHGYQKQLTYKHDDGSFSAFGNTDKSGSTWLTAFVVKSFAHAMEYISVDENVLKNATKWLMQQHLQDGSFREPGQVVYKPMQSAAGSGAALASYVLIALSEARERNNYPDQIRQTEEYLLRELRTTGDPYVTALITYALHISNNPNRDQAYSRLASLATRDDQHIYWKDPSVTHNITDYELHQTDLFFKRHFKDIEMTAYALLTLVNRGDNSQAIPVMQWLINQQNSNGGFTSTQDTVIAIEALSRIAATVASPTISIDVTVKFGEVGGSRTLRIESRNALTLQKLELPSELKWVEIEATGFGTAIIQVSWEFNLIVSSEEPAFYLNPLLDKTSTESYMQLSVCTHYRGEGNASNMAVMEVGLPSGYVFDYDTLSSIHRTNDVRRVESYDGDTNVVIYFDRVTKNELCVTVPAHREFAVAHQKPVPVKIYDYYDLAKSARIFYHPKKARVCDICTEDECSETCNDVDSQHEPEFAIGQAVDPSSSLRASTPFAVAIVTLICIALLRNENVNFFR